MSALMKLLSTFFMNRQEPSSHVSRWAPFFKKMSVSF